MVKDVHIVDTAFAHAPGMSWYNVPSLVKWVRGHAGRVPVRFFTDRSLGQVDNFPADINVALLIEPRCFDDIGYTICLKKRTQFQYCLTYDKEFKHELGESALFYPIGGCWLTQQQMGFWPKTKLFSIIASEKRQTHGHQLRHEIVRLHQGNSSLNVFGRGYHPVVYKHEALADYYFSVVVENGQTDDLFTEKIIDCFLTGTIPIYWGTHAIDKYFDMNGVFVFNTPDEASYLLKTLTPDHYQGALDAVKANFQRALQYRVAEDWIFKEYPFLLA